MSLCSIKDYVYRSSGAYTGTVVNTHTNRLLNLIDKFDSTAVPSPVIDQSVPSLRISSSRVYALSGMWLTYTYRGGLDMYCLALPMGKYRFTFSLQFRAANPGDYSIYPTFVEVGIGRETPGNAWIIDCPLDEVPISSSNPGFTRTYSVIYEVETPTYTTGLEAGIARVMPYLGVDGTGNSATAKELVYTYTDFIVEKLERL